MRLMIDTSPAVRQRFEKVVAQPVWCDDEEYLELLTVPFIDAPLPDLGASCLELVLQSADVRHGDGGTILPRVASAESETDPRTVTLQDDRRHRAITTLDFPHPEVLAIPARGLIEIRDG